MSKQGVPQRPQRVATPAYLPQRLASFRVGTGDRQTFVLRDNVKGQTYDFQPWQFFVMEVLPGCTDEPKLQSVFEDRFGRRLERHELERFFASLATSKLLNEAAAGHPLLAPFTTKTYVVEGERAVTAQYRAVDQTQVAPAAGYAAPGQAASAPAAHGAPHTPPAASTPVAAASAVRPIPAHDKPDEDATLPAGTQDAIDFDPRSTKWMWVWFNPTFLLKLTAPLLLPVKYFMFVLPVLLMGALMLIARNPAAVEFDLHRLVDGFGLVEHWLLSLLTVNLAVTVTTAVLAHRFRANVHGFGIALVMRFYPRFGTRIGHLDQLSRVERMWLNGAPLMVRLFMFSVGIYVWYATRANFEQLPAAALALSMTSAVSLLLSANPLVKGNGYHLLAAFTNEPHLRGKAFKTLLNKLRGGGFKEANDLLLATYAISMAAFMFILVAGAASFTGFALHQLHLGGSAIIIACIVGFTLLRRVLNYFSRMEAAYDRSVQFDRWRRRTHREDEGDPENATSRGFASYVWRAALLTFVVILFLPYDYRAGGEFVVHPRLQQVITTDVSGRIEEVYFDGGEEIEKGTVIATLAMAEDEAQAKILEKKIAEQRAVLDDFGSYPRPEDVRVARKALEVEETRVEFSRLELKRIKQLADQEIAPQEELDDARRTLAVDMRQLAEKKAELGVARLGATEFEVAEAQAKLEALEAERDRYLERIERAKLVMPFDGRLLTLHLKEKGNSYYQSGDVFADAEASGAMTAEIEIPESETENVEVGSTVQFKPIAYSSEVFTGTVVHIDWDITEKQFGNVVKVIAVLDDEDGQLKNGMSGYAKVDGPSLLVWEAFSQQIVRFFEVQVWSWIP